MPFVIDNSVVGGWVIGSQVNAYTDVVATLLLEDRAIAPALLHLELADVLRSACKRGKLIARDAHSLLDQIEAAARAAGVGVVAVP